MCHIHAYEYFGGVTRVLVPDNLKTGVTANTRYETQLNESYRELAEYYGTAIVPARVRKPQDKGLVERSVGFSTTWITAALREYKFFSFAEVKQAQMYRDTLHSSVDSISRKFAKKESFIKAKKSFDYGEDNVANIVSKLNMMSEEVNDFIDENKGNKEIACLVNAVEKNYGDIGETLVELNNNTENRAKFLSDYEAVGEFFDKNESKLESEQAHDLAIFLQKYTAYYAQLGKGRYLSDVNKMRVFKNYKSSLYFCSLLAVDPRINVENIEKDGVKKLVKNGDIIEVGIRRISDKTPYKIPYNSSVSANNLGTPVTDKMLLVFENGKLVKVSPLDIKNA